MENKIQELTDKIYREGVEKGNEEAQRLHNQDSWTLRRAWKNTPKIIGHAANMT